MPVLDVALWLLSHGKWREVGVLSISVGQKQEPLASCSRNEKVFFFFLSWLRVSKQADTTELTLCGATVNQPEHKSEMGRQPMAALPSWVKTEVHWKNAGLCLWVDEQRL